MTLKAAIDAGLRMEQSFSGKSMPLVAASPEQAPLEPPSPPASIAVHPPSSAPMALVAPEPQPPRRRGLLGLVRPAVLPFLDRLDSRIRWAVDRSTVAARLADVETRALAAEAQATAAHEAADVQLSSRLDQLGAASARVEQALAAVAHTLDAVTHRLDAIEIGLGAVRMGGSAQAISLRRAEAAILGASKDAQAAGERLDEVAQALVRQERRLDGLEEAGGRWVEQRLAERLEALDQRTAERIEALDGNSAQRHGPLLQAVKRLVLNLGPDLVIKTPNGYVLAPAEDAAVVVALVEGPGMLETGTTAVVQALLRPGGTMVDVGGHIGLLALPGARQVGRTGRVVVLEPTPRLAQLIRRTMALNGVEWVQVHQCAGGDADGVAPFTLSSHTSHSSLFPVDTAVEQIEVPIHRLDTLLPPGTKVDLVKIDAEGAELLVWRGMRRLLADNPAAAVIVEFGPSHLQRVGTTTADWFAELTAAGHTPWEIDDMSGHLRPLRATGLDEVFSINILLLRGDPTRCGLVAA